MNAPERHPLRDVIDQQQGRLRAEVPSDRQAAILALIRRHDQLPHSSGVSSPPDLVTGRHLVGLGMSKALQLCLEAAGDDEERSATSTNGLDAWAERVVDECGRLAEVELVLAHCETGFMQMADHGDDTFDAWITTRRVPPSWRERADLDWWASWLARRHGPELFALPPARAHPESGDAGNDALYRTLAGVHLKVMAYQLDYPPETTIGGCTVKTFRAVLAWLIGWTLQARDRDDAPAPHSERALVGMIASALVLDPAVIARAVTAFTLDRKGAAYHAAVPGVAGAPLIRVAPDQLVPSVHGLTSEPLLFLTSELKRCDAQAYHNTAYLREGVFRQDLYGLFSDKRFVTSAGRIQLRRAGGDLRTDIDAVVFDRKTGTLGVFELKSQDPFSRSSAALSRQRDNLLYANRQISGMLAWLQRHGADDLLGRVDTRTARTFQVQKVYPFVLGRYIAHFNDGPVPDHRAAWGAWPQLLRLLDGRPFGATDANPLASLFTRLRNDVPLSPPSAGERSREIMVGPTRLTVHPSWAAYGKSEAARPNS